MSTKSQNGKSVRAFIIANPLYDTVFKRLMENKLIVKFFLSTILEQQVVSVEVLPQEFTYKGNVTTDSEEIPYSIFRVDFMATVQTADGKQKKILIEVQKAWNHDDIMRFRKYLGEQYGKKEVIHDKETTLPITTIYILGFDLVGIENPCIKVGRTYTDMRNRETIHAKSDFIELLTHDSYVIQAGRIKDTSYTSDLDKLLSIFEQAYFIRTGSELVKEYHHQPDDENMDIITSVLCEMVSDPAERKQLEDEAEAMRILDAVYFSKIRENKNIIEEQAKSLAEHAKILVEKDKSLKEKDKSLKEKDKVLKEKDKVLEEQSKSLKEKNKFLNEKDKQIAELQLLLQSK